MHPGREAERQQDQAPARGEDDQARLRRALQGAGLPRHLPEPEHDGIREDSEEVREDHREGGPVHISQALKLTTLLFRPIRCAAPRCTAGAEADGRGRGHLRPALRRRQPAQGHEVPEARAAQGLARRHLLHGAHGRLLRRAVRGLLRHGAHGGDVLLLLHPGAAFSRPRYRRRLGICVGVGVRVHGDRVPGAEHVRAAVPAPAPLRVQHGGVAQVPRQLRLHLRVVAVARRRGARAPGRVPRLRRVHGRRRRRHVRAPRPRAQVGLPRVAARGSHPRVLAPGVPAAAVLPDQRRVPVQSVSVPQDTEEHCTVTALQGCNGRLLHGRSALQPGAYATEPGVPGVLLHQWELLDAGVRLLHQHQAHQRPGLRRLLPAVLLESHAVRTEVVRRGGHEPPGEPGQVRLRHARRRRQSGVREGQEPGVAVAPRRRVQRRDGVPAVLGLRQGLGPAPAQLQEPLAQERPHPQEEIHILPVNGTEPCAEARLAADHHPSKFWELGF
uniref:Uncharacterized protein n=1 Tax=Zea mays TaxID=4577 RepID=C0P4V2_MAIZE|nr:unknown [Zea mays]|eukprot:NP_001168379.1 uncharacterized protein LOC100382148 [Zea mays]